MIRIFGIPIAGDDVRRLVATLLVESTPDALSAATILEKGVARDLYAVALTRGERAAILACQKIPATDWPNSAVCSDGAATGRE